MLLKLQRVPLQLCQKSAVKMFGNPTTTTVTIVVIVMVEDLRWCSFIKLYDFVFNYYKLTKLCTRAVQKKKNCLILLGSVKNMFLFPQQKFSFFEKFFWMKSNRYNIFIYLPAKFRKNF